MYLVVWYHRVERVVCVNPRRRRWCRDGIPDSGNAVQIPSLLPLTAISFSPCPPTIATLSILQEVMVALVALVALVAGRRCDVKHAGAGAPGSSNTPSVPPRASLCHKTNSSAKRLCQYTSITASISGQSLSLNMIHVINAEVMVSFTTSERLIDLVAKVNSVVMISWTFARSWSQLNSSINSCHQ